MIFLYKEYDFYSSVIVWNLYSEIDFDVVFKYVFLLVFGV